MPDPIAFDGVIPVLRVFDVAKADAFYLGFLGLRLDWEHRFGENFPLYRQVSRAGLILHLSEHHGDGSPGAQVRIAIRGLRALHSELAAKDYRFFRPEIVETQWSTLEMSVTDPFGSRLVFAERAQPSQ